MSKLQLHPGGKRGATFLVVGEILLLTLAGLGVHTQWVGMNRSINNLAELRDPSPFRAALAGNLGRIQLAMQGFLRSADATLADQAARSATEFESSLPEFQKQNNKLFPQQAVSEIKDTFGAYKAAIERTLEAHSSRQSTREQLDHNFAEIIRLIQQNIRPLLRSNQNDYEDRREGLTNIENQARAWQQQLSRAWADLKTESSAMTFESDDRGLSYIDQYFRMQLLPRERQVMKTVRGLWQSNSDIARKSFAMERVVRETETSMGAFRDQVNGAINKYLPAISPSELEAIKQRFILSTRLRGALVMVFGLLGIASIAWSVRATGKSWRLESESAGGRTGGPAKDEPMVKMSLKGLLTGWSAEAESLYGYQADEVLGESIAKLFESEADIQQLYAELGSASKTSFESMHRNKDGMLFRAAIDFMPIADAKGNVIAIGLKCKKK